MIIIYTHTTQSNPYPPLSTTANKNIVLNGVSHIVTTVKADAIEYMKKMVTRHRHLHPYTPTPLDTETPRYNGHTTSLYP